MFDRLLRNVSASITIETEQMFCFDQQRHVQWWYGCRYFGKATSLSDTDLTAMVKLAEVTYSLFLSKKYSQGGFNNAR